MKDNLYLCILKQCKTPYCLTQLRNGEFKCLYVVKGRCTWKPIFLCLSPSSLENRTWEKLWVVILSWVWSRAERVRESVTRQGRMRSEYRLVFCPLAGCDSMRAVTGHCPCEMTLSSLCWNHVLWNSPLEERAERKLLPRQCSPPLVRGCPTRS